MERMVAGIPACLHDVATVPTNLCPACKQHIGVSFSSGWRYGSFLGGGGQSISPDLLGCCAARSWVWVYVPLIHQIKSPQDMDVGLVFYTGMDHHVIANAHLHFWGWNRCHSLLLWCPQELEDFLCEAVQRRSSSTMLGFPSFWPMPELTVLEEVDGAVGIHSNIPLDSTYIVVNIFWRKFSCGPRRWICSDSLPDLFYWGYIVIFSKSVVSPHTNPIAVMCKVS